MENVAKHMRLRMQRIAPARSNCRANFMLYASDWAFYATILIWVS
jgi:acyl-CoA thioesterase